MTRIAVTGGSGKAGRATVRDLMDHGYDVTNLDRVESPDPVAPLVVVDLTAPDEVREALAGHNAVVHLAAIPTPRGRFDEPTFRNNVMSTYNVLCLAAELGMQRIVWASSETVLGLPFDAVRPPSAPLDEAWPQHPETGYALAKAASELIAAQVARWSGIPTVGLRFSNIMEPERYAQFPTFWEDPHARKWNLWGYVDAREAAQACRLGLEAEIAGAEVFIIAAADTVMNRPNAELMAEVFPDVPLKEGTGEFETLLSIDKARRLLGYNPQWSWRDHIADR